MQVSFVNSGENQINVHKSDTCNAYISQTLGSKYVIAFLGKHDVREPFLFSQVWCNLLPFQSLIRYHILFFLFHVSSHVHIPAYTLIFCKNPMYIKLKETHTKGIKYLH